VSWLRPFLAIVLVVVIAALVATHRTLSGYAQSLADICQLTQKNFYKPDDEQFQNWLLQCEAEAKRVPIWSRRQPMIQRIHQVMSLAPSSHLALYEPQENEALWQNVGDDTGLRARVIDGEFVIYEVISESPGEEAGVQIGDVVSAIDDQTPVSVEQIRDQGGSFRLRRGSSLVQLKVLPRRLTLNLEPTLSQLENGTAVMRVQSFLPQYFVEYRAEDFAQRLSAFDHLILDLRGNFGGSFPAMLRLASTFLCEPTQLGSVFQSDRSTQSGATALKDDLSPISQLQQLASHREIHLISFQSRACYSNKMTVLIDSSTSSVAEILADGLRERAQTRIWGLPSAGQVVVALWFQVPKLGPGDYSLSIPIAGYRSRSGFELEGEGVNPDRMLAYRLSEAIEGRDSWLQGVMRDSDFRPKGRRVQSVPKQDRHVSNP